MNLQEKVGHYVEANETTMGAVADKLGISRSSLFNKLRGTSEFSLSEALNLSRILGMTVDELCRLAMKSDWPHRRLANEDHHHREQNRRGVHGSSGR